MKRTLAVSCLLATSGLTGCTSAAPTSAPSPDPKGVVGSRPVVTVAAAKLSCVEGTRGITPPDASTPRHNGLISDGWSTEEVSPATPDAPEEASFWKTFLYVTADAAPWSTVSIAPDTARLYFVPFSAWSTGGSTLDTTHLASGRADVMVQFCGEEPLGYTGGVMTAGPVCATITVSAPDRPPATIRLSLGAPCP